MSAELRETDRALLAFLRARLDEDESVALAAAEKHGQTWNSDGEYLHVLDTGGDRPIAVNPWGGHDGPLGPHIARHDPARVLAEVAVKRSIISHYENAIAVDVSEVLLVGQAVVSGIVAVKHTMLTLIAVPYRDHPDYRQEWLPWTG